MKMVILGLSITSSWGNGHATTYRSLVHGLADRGHDILFLERDQPWYAENRDLPNPPFGRTALYGGLDELRARFADPVRDADLLIVGSYVPEGIAVAEWALAMARGVTAFYDIDTPITFEALGRGQCMYLDAALVPRFNLYLSFSGGPILAELARRYQARLAVPLYCSVDLESYQPQPGDCLHILGYMGTYSPDRQSALDRLLLDPARQLPMARFVVAGPQFPETITWPANVERITHVAPGEHRAFYASQRFTLNITRAAMAAAGYSPSVRLFEAAALGVPVISDEWPGLDSFFVPGEEILAASTSEEVLVHLLELGDERAAAIGGRARARVLAEHTGTHRAIALEGYVAAARGFT
ncbi:MAG TPA: glycosyltransferase [Chloroflexota bacterium]|nr:glycosyltransferase [Chloroflexota bacterium]